MITLTRFAKLNQEKLKAVADIVIDGGIKIHGVALFLNKDNEYFIKFPEDKREDKYYPIVEVDDISLKSSIYEKILAEYKK